MDTLAQNLGAASRAASRAWLPRRFWWQPLQAPDERAGKASNPNAVPSLPLANTAHFLKSSGRFWLHRMAASEGNAVVQEAEPMRSAGAHHADTPAMLKTETHGASRQALPHRELTDVGLGGGAQVVQRLQDAEGGLGDLQR